MKVLEIFNSARFKIFHMNNKQKLLLLAVTLTIAIFMGAVVLTATNPHQATKSK